MYNKPEESVRKKFWDGKGENGTQLDFSTEGFQAAVDRARKDMMPRNLKRINPDDKALKKDLYDTLSTSFKEWFTGTSEDFNTWHHTTCERVLKNLNDYYTKPDGSSVLYGKAQKIVNMTMKNLYCLDGAKDYEEKFKDCHMPLDSFILEWLYRKSQNAAGVEKLKRNKMSSWSNIQYGEDENCNPSEEKDSEYTYQFYVKTIREIISGKDSPYHNLTPFQAEFYIWPEIQKRLACEAFVKAMKDPDDPDNTQSNLSSLSDDELLKQVNKVCENIRIG